MRLPAILLAACLTAAPATGQVESIESLRDRAAALAQARRAELETEIRGLLEQILEASREAREREVERLRAKLLGHGTIAGLLLLENIDVEVDAMPSSIARADEAATLLVRLPRPPLLPGLLDLTRTGSSGGRLRAIEILGHWPRRDEVAGRLVQVSADGRQVERAAAVAALARLGGAEAEARLSAILADDQGDPLLIDRTLVAIGHSAHPELVALVQPLLSSSDRIVAHVDAILSFLRSVPTALDEQRALFLIELVRRRKLQQDDAEAALDRIGRGGFPLRGPVGAALNELEEYGSRDAAESALVALALLGDSSALRRLEDDYSERIERSRDPDDHRPYAARAAIYLRVDEFKKARRDYEKAIDLDGGWGGPVDQLLYVELARTLVRSDDLPRAAEALEAARLGPELAAGLAADEDFAPLVASRFGEVLR
jgi:tetratricopeptide (TPR) repeat protein